MARTRQRASARDYQSAYGEGEDAFAEDQRRSSGPWLLLLALLAAALVTGGVVWYYNTNMKNVAGTGTSVGRGSGRLCAGRSRQGRARSARRRHGGARRPEEADL